MLNKKIHLAALVSLSSISFSTATFAMEPATQIITAEALQNETLANVSPLNRFSNVDVNYGPRVRALNVGDRFDNSTYLKARSAKTSVSFKF